MRPWQVLRGDVREVARGIESRSFDALFCDPPYGLSFMGQRWDYRVPSVNVWAELLRCLRPGAPGFIFGGSRTFHRLAVAVEDGGFEIRDVCMWLYGTGFPKSLDVSKAVDKAAKADRTEVVGHKQSGLDKGSGATVSFSGSSGRDATGLIPLMKAATALRERWQGYGTALKPAYEPALLVRRLPEGSIAANVEKYGVGGIAIDASRVGDGGGPAAVPGARTGMFGMGGVKEIVQLDAGRWPSNVVLDEEAGALLDEQSGYSHGKRVEMRPPPPGRRRSPRKSGGVYSQQAGQESVVAVSGDDGGASRFFYTAKASRAERDRGCEGLEAGGRSDVTDRDIGGSVHTKGVTLAKNDHPTVKPQDLIRYFARMILPPERVDGKPRRILVPFSGSGSEMIGCLQAGWDEVVGIERESRFADIAEARIRRGDIFKIGRKK